MLLEFSIENFLSFKNKVSFSMLANTTKGLENNYVELPSGKKVLKTAAIFGHIFYLLKLNEIDHIIVLSIDLM